MTRDTIQLSRRVLIANALGLVAVGRPAAASTRGVKVGRHDHAHALEGLQVQSSPDQSDSSPAKLSKPWLAGQPRERIRDADNDPFIIEIERQVKCNCGCAHSLYACRTTDFVCGFWQPLHAEVAEMANQGMTAEEIIDAYVAKHGTQFLMAPPPHGFNLAGYLVPSILISLVGATLVFVLRRRVNMTSAVSTGSGSSAGLSDSEHARIVAELEKLGS